MPTAHGKNDWLPIIPDTWYDPTEHTAFHATAVRAEYQNHYKSLNTVVTKPVVVSTKISSVTGSFIYSYDYPPAFVLNSAYSGFYSSNNEAVINARTVIEYMYGDQLAAPLARCDSSINNGLICHTFNTYNNDAYRRMTLPASTAASAYNTLLPAADALTVTSDTPATNPTRIVNFYINYSK